MSDIKELKEEDLKKVSGGTGDSELKYQPGYTYMTHSSLISCSVEVKSFKERKNNENYYNVEYSITYVSRAGHGRHEGPKQTVLSEEQITNKVFINW